VYGGIAWNVFLAAIPVAAAYLMAAAEGRARKRPLWNIILLAAGLVWLVFLPNTCYLLTEWRHFLMELDQSNLYLQSRLNPSVTLLLMFYTAFYFCYSAVGMLAFALAIRPVAALLRRVGARTWVWGLPLFLLMSVGVYLGLVMRFNSWELLTRPGEIWASVERLALRPRLSAFIVFFGAFLWLAYGVIDIWIDGLLARLRAVSGGP